MKLTVYLLAGLVGVAMISCQKSYDPPGLVLNDSTSNGSGSGGGSSNGTQLVKAETKLVGSKEASTEAYEYDAAGKLIRVVTTDTDSTGKSASYYYRYQRDASGRVTKIVTNVLAANAPGAGYPDSIVYTVHYPASGGFDYAVSSFTLATKVFKDSTAYTYNAGGAVSDSYNYQSTAGMPMAFNARMQFAFTGGNLVNLKVYDASTGPSTVSGTYSFEFDNKPAALKLDNDAFLPGLDPGFYSTNNPTKNTLSAYTYNEVLQYAYQYNNTTQKPSTATITQTTTKETYNITYTYK